MARPTSPAEPSVVRAVDDSSPAESAASGYPQLAATGQGVDLELPRTERAARCTASASWVIGGLGAAVTAFVVYLSETPAYRNSLILLFAFWTAPATLAVLSIAWWLQTMPRRLHRSERSMRRVRRALLAWELFAALTTAWLAAGRFALVAGAIPLIGLLVVHRRLLAELASNGYPIDPAGSSVLSADGDG